jgi:hypothetical protein
MNNKTKENKAEKKYGRNTKEDKHQDISAAGERDKTDTIQVQHRRISTTLVSLPDCWCVFRNAPPTTALQATCTHAAN